MKTIFKFEIPIHGLKVEMPIGATILSADFQGDELYVWALVDTAAPYLVQEFRVYGTGHEIALEDQDCLVFVDTCHTHNGLVFHVFEYQEKQS